MQPDGLVLSQRPQAAQAVLASHAEWLRYQRVDVGPFLLTTYSSGGGSSGRVSSAAIGIRSRAWVVGSRYAIQRTTSGRTTIGKAAPDSATKMKSAASTKKLASRSEG